jgi:anaerobic ribonucleoside-triphosphate reductase activating protein
MRKNPLLDGITLSGGEPFEQADKMGLLAARTKEMGYDVMAYSGYRYEEILEKSERDKGWQSLILNTDILVDGRFELENKDLLLKFRGSKNQRIIDVKESMKIGKAIILD